MNVESRDVPDAQPAGVHEAEESPVPRCEPFAIGGGEAYVVRVSGRSVSVRVTGTREVAHGRDGWFTAWDAVNLATGRRSPQRFRARFERNVSQQAKPEIRWPAGTEPSRRGAANLHALDGGKSESLDFQKIRESPLPRPESSWITKN